MPGCFFDSSALAKHYHVEVGTVEVDRILQLPDARHFIARLALVEIRSVFAVNLGDVAGKCGFDIGAKLLSIHRLLAATLWN